MNNDFSDKEWLDWLWEGRGELYGCLPPQLNAGEPNLKSERHEMESASE